MTFHTDPAAIVSRDALAERRAALFRETPVDVIERWALGLAWALKPNRIGGVPALARLWLTDLISPSRELPRPQSAFDQPDGLCGIVHDLSVPALVEAHRRGLYPHCHMPPLKWWSPAERWILSFDEFHIARRLRSILRQARYTVTFDRDFEAVIKACAGRRGGKWHLTWITPRIMGAYAALYDAGHAHSYEVWNAEGALVGGGYGVAAGRGFTIESRFAWESNTSKIGLAVLNWHLAKWCFRFIDNKGPNQNVIEMGFRPVPRSEFCALLAQEGDARAPGRWQVETDFRTVADWQPKHTTPSAAAPLQPQLQPGVAVPHEAD